MNFNEWYTSYLLTDRQRNALKRTLAKGQLLWSQSLEEGESELSIGVDHIVPDLSGESVFGLLEGKVVVAGAVANTSVGIQTPEVIRSMVFVKKYEDNTIQAIITS